MRTKTPFDCLVFIALTLVMFTACAGKTQSLAETSARDYAALKVDAPVQPDAAIKPKTTPDVTEKAEATSKTMLPPPSLQNPSEKTNQPPLPPLLTPTATATVSTTVDIEKKSPSSSPPLSSPPEEAVASEKVSPPASKDEEIVFNFDNADIHEVINTISDILGFNYIVDPRVAGRVNIRTKGTLSKKALFSVLESLLKINNFTITKKGEFYHILPIQAVKQDYIPPQIVLDKEALPITDKFIIQIVPLKFISAQEISKIIKPLVSVLGLVIPKDNILILLDSSANINKLLTLIELFDEDVFERVHMQLYEAKNVDVEELTKELETIFKAFELSADRARAGGINFVPITRINMLLAVSSNDRLLEKAIQWAREMDTEVSETAIKIHVYYVQNGKAGDIVDVLTQVFKGETKKKETAFKSKLRETKTTTKRKKSPPRKPAPTRSTAAEAVVGEVDIVVDEVNNAIIVRATERDYRTVENTIKKLDIYPKQVLIEVLIAEIRLDDESKMGVEWEYMNEIRTGYDYTTTATGVTDLATEITSGLKYMVNKTGRFKATLKAFAAKDKVNILSSPHIIASDNKEAVINITEEIPIVSGQVTTATAEPVITQSTEYRDTGIILKVTPHINDKGLVTLDVSQEVSSQSERAATGSSNPIFLKRSAQTSMVVQDGQSVVIGGLIKEEWSKGKAGVPILSSIPVLGALFGYHKKTLNRSELMLLLTPHVITSIEDADLITQEFRDKLTIIKDKERLKRGTP